MASDIRTFTTTLRAGDRGGAYVDIPFDVEAEYGSKRVPIRATIDGEPYRGSLVRMGGHHRLGVLKAIRERIGKVPGDLVTVTLERDTDERVIRPPPDLAAALAKDANAAKFFESLSYTHRREYVQWIEEAKREETRARRVSRTVEMLREGRRGR